MLIQTSQLFGSVNQVQRYEKNVIGGAIHAYVFKHGKRIRTSETKCSDALS